MYINNLLTAVADVPSAPRDASKGIIVVSRTRLELGEGRFLSLLHKRGKSSSGWTQKLHYTPAFKRALKNFSSGLIITTFSYIFIHVIIFKTLPFVFIFIVLDIVIRCRSICRRRTKSIVVSIVVDTETVIYSNKWRVAATVSVQCNKEVTFADHSFRVVSISRLTYTLKTSHRVAASTIDTDTLDSLAFIDICNMRTQARYRLEPLLDPEWRLAQTYLNNTSALHTLKKRITWT